VFGRVPINTSSKRDLEHLAEKFPEISSEVYLIGCGADPANLRLLSVWGGVTGP
jgi:hypothetical protein